ncbi:hypothetical protein [Haladaptatus caseinilyticus]|uniref:hypothetical protein n=1 Tax=Haladaptatus caseinilyticus TaxID=2993314 RepID=UPI00224A9DA0|nr:hypothetical protein [Haladaptatus caseinilyticus]
MSSLKRTAQSVQGIALSTFISAVFALGWGLYGSAGLPVPYETVGQFVVIGVTLALLALALYLYRKAQRLPTEDSGNMQNPFTTRAYGISVVLMVIAFPIAGTILTRVGFESAITSVVAIIVGLHFFGLVRAFDAPIFAAIGSAMCSLGVISLMVPMQVVVGGGSTIALRQSLIGFGCALILLASQARTIREILQQRKSMPTERRSL